MDEAARLALKAACPRRLNGHRPQSVAAQLAELAALPEAALPADMYGKGGAQAALEAEVAGLLGKPAAVFLPKGVIAQLAALRVWRDRTGRGVVALHPQSHLEADEGGAYAAVNGLRAVRLGNEGQPFTHPDLAAVAEPLAAVIVELPLRRAAFRLPAWDELQAICATAAGQGAGRHMDGARLWESAAWFGRSYAEISALFDSVYVSFYKGLGGLGGAALAGEGDFVAEAQAWLHRHGAHPYTTYPYALGALRGLRRHLPRMGEYRQRAVEIAEALSGAGLIVSPPQTNAFQVALPIPAARAIAASAGIAQRRGVWLLDRVLPSAFDALSTAEIQIGEAAEDLATAELVELFAELVAAAGG